MRDIFVVAPPTLDFQGQVKRPLKPPTQVGVDGAGNIIKSFPFNTKGARRSAVLRLAKTTRRHSLSLLQRVTSSCNTTSIVYKYSESSEETSAVTSTTTASVLDDTHPDGKKCEQCTDGSGSRTGDMSTSSDDTKSLSVIPDTEDEGSFVNVNDAPVSPVFGVKGPSSFSTEYPEDSSNAFLSQGLVEVDKLGSSMEDCSEDLFSDADQHEQVLPMEMEGTHEVTETETFSENTVVENAEDVHSTEMTPLQGTYLYLGDLNPIVHTCQIFHLQQMSTVMVLIVTMYMSKTSGMMQVHFCPHLLCHTGISHIQSSFYLLMIMSFVSQTPVTSKSYPLCRPKKILKIPDEYDDELTSEIKKSSAKLLATKPKTSRPQTSKSLTSKPSTNKTKPQSASKKSVASAVTTETKQTLSSKSR